MEFSHLLANDSVVGIDIGSNQIKIVLAEPTRGGSRITNAAICATPPDTVKEGVVVDVAEVAAAIKNCMRSAGIKSPNAIAAIAGPGVTVRQVQLLAMKEQLLRQSIRFEANKYISTAVEDSVIEFDILGPAVVEGQMNVIIAAAPRVMVETRVLVLERAGLDPLAVDVEVLASLRSLMEYNSQKHIFEHPVALLDLGASHSEINLISQGNLEIYRTIPISGDSLSSAIRNALNCTPGEAEAHKREVDLQVLCDTPAGSTQDPVLRGIQQLIDELLREIRRSINYYQSQAPDSGGENSVDTIILTGGGAAMKGIAPYITSRLGLQVVAGNLDMLNYMHLPADNLVKPEEIALFSVAFGLATKESRALSTVESSAA